MIDKRSIDKKTLELIEEIGDLTIIRMSSSDYAHATLSVEPNTRTYKLFKKTYQFFENLCTKVKMCYDRK